jgi:hypothetical protein
VKDQAKEIESHYKKVDKDLQTFDKVLKEEGNRIVMEDVKARIRKAKIAAEEEHKLYDPEDNYNVAELIVENKLLIDKVDALFGKREITAAIKAHSSS